MDNKFSLISIVPESTKEEALNPASNLIGLAFRGIAHKVLGPLVRYNIVKDEELKDFAEKTRTKTDKIPEENRDDSMLGLAYKAAEDSSYQLNSEVLREMFSNLISATVDNRKNSNVRPSFSSILKDLSPEDAILFKFIHEKNTVPIVTVRVQNKDNYLGIDVRKNIILADDTVIEQPSSLISLQTFGLIAIKPEIFLSAKRYADQYERYKETAFYKSIESSLPNETSDGLILDSVHLQKGSISTTALGIEFGNVIL